MKGSWNAKQSLAAIGFIALGLICHGELELPPLIGADDALPQRQIASYLELCNNNGFEHAWQSLSGKCVWGEFVKVLTGNQIEIRYISKGEFKQLRLPLDSLTTENLLYVMMRSKGLLAGVDISSDSEFETRLDTARAWCYLIRFSQNHELRNKYLDKYNALAKKCRDRHNSAKQKEESVRQAQQEIERRERERRAAVEYAKAKAEQDRAERQRELEREAEARRRELESRRSVIQNLVAKEVAERVNEFFNAIYDGLGVSKFFADDKAYKIFMYHDYFSHPARSWNIHEQILLGTPVNTIKTGVPMARVKVDYLGYTYNIWLDYSEATGMWYVSLISKITYVDSPPNWTELPLAPFQSLLRQTTWQSDMRTNNDNRQSDNRLVCEEAFATLLKMRDQFNSNLAKAKMASDAYRLEEAEQYANICKQLLKGQNDLIKTIEVAAANGYSQAVILVNSQKWKDFKAGR